VGQVGPALSDALNVGDRSAGTNYSNGCQEPMAGQIAGKRLQYKSLGQRFQPVLAIINLQSTQFANTNAPRTGRKPVSR
jgi:hypothetical protein